MAAITLSLQNGSISVSGNNYPTATVKVIATATATEQEHGGDVNHAASNSTTSATSGLGSLSSTYVLSPNEQGQNDDSSFKLLLTEDTSAGTFSYVDGREYQVTAYALDSNNNIISTSVAKARIDFVVPPTSDDLGPVTIETTATSITLTAASITDNISQCFIALTGKESTGGATKTVNYTFTKAEMAAGATIDDTDAGIAGGTFIGGFIAGDVYKGIISFYNAAGSSSTAEEVAFTAVPNSGANAPTQVQVTSGATLLINSATSIPASSMEIGSVYKILTAGDTDFTLLGASSNDVGTVFTATADVTGSTGTVESLVSGFQVDPYKVGTTSDETLVISAKIGTQLNNDPDTTYILQVSDTTDRFMAFSVSGAGASAGYLISDGYVRFFLKSSLEMYTTFTDALNNSGTTATQTFLDGNLLSFAVGAMNSVNTSPTYSVFATGKASGLPEQIQSGDIKIRTGSQLEDTGSAAAITYVDQSSWSSKISISIKPSSDNGSPITGFSFSVGGVSITKQLADMVTETSSSWAGYYTYVAENGVDGVTLVDGTSYEINEIKAINANGDSDPQSTASATPSTKPDAVSSNFAQPKANTQTDPAYSGSLRADWSIPAGDGGATITGYSYRIRKNSDLSVQAYVADTGNTDTFFQLTENADQNGNSITLGVEYKIEVAAKNKNGIGAYTYSQVSAGDTSQVFIPSKKPNLGADWGTQLLTRVTNTFLLAPSVFTLSSLGAIINYDVTTSGGYDITSYVVEVADTVDGSAGAAARRKTVLQADVGSPVVFDNADAITITNGLYTYTLAVYPLNSVYSTYSDSTPSYLIESAGSSPYSITMSTAYLDIDGSVALKAGESVDDQLTFEWSLLAGDQYAPLTDFTIDLRYNRPERASQSSDIIFTTDYATTGTNLITGASSTLDGGKYVVSFVDQNMINGNMYRIQNGWEYYCQVTVNQQQTDKAVLTNLTALTPPSLKESAQAVPKGKPGLSTSLLTGGSTVISVQNNGSALDNCFLLTPASNGTSVRDIVSEVGFSIKDGANTLYYKTVDTATTINAGALVNGTLYKIATAGSDFTQVGASSNDVGTVFTATGATAGTGTVYPYQVSVPTFNEFYNGNNSSISLMSYSTPSVAGIAVDGNNQNQMLVVADNDSGATITLNGSPLGLSV